MEDFSKFIKRERYSGIVTMKIFTEDEKFDQMLLSHYITLFEKGMLGPYNSSMVQLLVSEVKRLRKGDFTEEEFNTLLPIFLQNSKIVQSFLGEDK